jgi:hypothetical protein
MAELFFSTERDLGKGRFNAKMLRAGRRLR